MNYLKQNNKIYSSYSFKILFLPYFTELHSQWYTKVNNKNIKIVSMNIVDLLIPISLAYWFIGDGSFYKINKTIKLSTESFTFEEVTRL